MVTSYQIQNNLPIPPMRIAFMHRSCKCGSKVPSWPRIIHAFLSKHRRVLVMIAVPPVFQRSFAISSMAKQPWTSLLTRSK